MVTDGKWITLIYSNFGVRCLRLYSFEITDEV